MNDQKRKRVEAIGIRMIEANEGGLIPETTCVICEKRLQGGDGWVAWKGQANDQQPDRPMTFCHECYSRHDSEYGFSIALPDFLVWLLMDHGIATVDQYKKALARLNFHMMVDRSILDD